MRAAPVCLLALLLLAGCDGGAPASDDQPGAPVSPPTSPTGPVDTAAGGSGEPPRDLGAAVSRVREDSYYADVGEPDIDALCYRLDLSWDPPTGRLSGVATIVFRAPTDETRLQLDLADTLQTSSVRLDGETVHSTHPGKDLRIFGVRLSADSRHTLQIAYAGTPGPVAAPTSRPDVEDLGWHTTSDGGAWTMQEPFGAYTWYPVNDQPSDKAYFAVRIDTPDTMRGVSGGQLVSDTLSAGRRISSFRLARPVASYLTTIAIGAYQQVTDTGPAGLPLTYWVLPGQEVYLQELEKSPELISWLVERLGPFPFPTAGVVLVPSRSGMETQETITIGAGPDPRTFLANLLHEYAHQWYGDTVTPLDWKDLWLNESFATYLQLDWMTETGIPVSPSWASGPRRYDQELRDQYGPPGAYAAQDFASPNVYYCGALMLQRLRGMVGDAAFGRLLRGWPHARAYAGADRGDWIAFVQRRTHRRLRGFVLDWLLSERTPT